KVKSFSVFLHICTQKMSVKSDRFGGENIIFTYYILTCGKKILRAGEGNDVIADYVDGVDRFVLGGGLEFNELTIVQNITNTQIQIAGTSEVLATLNSVTANFLNAEDFIVES
ncbi:MAG: hypothetical protein QNJ18_00885, partial [Xenococcaceae cyanobacterium MO_167.B52]|nr:hypothetical protein [Xenococcaceae cyanobacterium MO_167.B52]